MTIEFENQFKEACKAHLPKYIRVKDKDYALQCNGLLTGAFRISYIEFDGNRWNYSNKLLDLFYDIVEKIPEEKEYNKNEIKNCQIYVKNIDGIIYHCLKKLKKFNYEELPEILNEETKFYRREQEFKKELEQLLNKYSKENGSDTPDFILCNYLYMCLDTYDKTLQSREQWYGRDLKRTDVKLTATENINFRKIPFVPKEERSQLCEGYQPTDKLNTTNPPS